jgi:hypothetical protein
MLWHHFVAAVVEYFIGLPISRRHIGYIGRSVIDHICRQFGRSIL